MIEQYLDILEESLQQKQKVLDEITLFNQRQEESLKAEDVSLEDFDAAADEKTVLIDKLLKLDEGFDSLYHKIKEELAQDKDKHKAHILSLQKLIGEVTEKSVAVQAQEARNKKLVEAYFKKQRQQMKGGRKSSKTAYNYYKKMNGSDVVLPQFVDKKK